MPSVVVAALYQFVALPDYQALREPLVELCRKHLIKGTLLLAEEGINGTVSGSRGSIDALIQWLEEDGRFDNLEYKESSASEHPFLRMKVKLKKEIVTMGVEGVSPTVCVGNYVKAEDWNDLISDPNVLVVDTRNEYEFDIGTFKGAINPHTDSFREFPEVMSKLVEEHKPTKVAMFCTGGIRCEKSTSLLKSLGMDDVYHLKGGILRYLEDVPAQESLWEGECFVFDHRVSVKHGLEQGKYDLCHGCRLPITEEDKASPLFENGVTCPKCHDKLSEDQKTRFRERQKQMELAKARRRKHMGEF